MFVFKPASTFDQKSALSLLGQVSLAITHKDGYFTVRPNEFHSRAQEQYKQACKVMEVMFHEVPMALCPDCAVAMETDPNGYPECNHKVFNMIK